jgi:predicted RNA-binding Zn ribbon-like protein
MAVPVDRRAAPPPLDLVEAFLNTVDLEQGKDAFETPARMQQWLKARKLIGTSQPVMEAHQKRLIRLREALRRAAAANNDAVLDRRTLQELNQLARRAQLIVAFDRDGRAGFEASSKGSDPGLAQILAAVGVSMLTGSWRRLKTCANDGCQWAFYDASKNRSGRWCDMSDCGNDAKGRAFRARQRLGRLQVSSDQPLAPVTR